MNHPKQAESMGHECRLVGELPLHLGDERVAALLITEEGLGWIPVDKMPAMHRVMKASDFMLDLHQSLTRFRMNDLLEPVLSCVSLFGDQALPLEVFVWRRKIDQVHRNVMAVILGQDLIGLAESESLMFADTDFAIGTGPVLLHSGGRIERLPVKEADAAGSLRVHLELDVGHAKFHITKGTGPIAAYLISPRAGDINILFAATPRKERIRQSPFDLVQSCLQTVKVRHDDANMTSQHLRLIVGEVELLVTNVDPHIKWTEVNIGITGKSETVYIEERSQTLVRHREVDMFQRQDVSHVLGGAIEFGRFHAVVNTPPDGETQRRILCLSKLGRPNHACNASCKTLRVRDNRSPISSSPRPSVSIGS